MFGRQTSFAAKNVLGAKNVLATNIRQSGVRCTVSWTESEISGGAAALSRVTASHDPGQGCRTALKVVVFPFRCEGAAARIVPLAEPAGSSASGLSNFV